MKLTEYKRILAAIEQAIAVCDGSVEFMDAVQRKICEDLHNTRTELLRLIKASRKPSAG